MAGAGPKKRLEENKKRLQILQILVGLGFLAQAASLWLQGVSTWRLIGFAGTVLAAGGSYFGIASLASPVYDGNGTLIDGGADLDRVSQLCLPCPVAWVALQLVCCAVQGGMCGYLHDILYVSAFTQVRSSNPAVRRIYSVLM
jgi:hypothetical protein